jgi:hypothetical protein
VVKIVIIIIFQLKFLSYFIQLLNSIMYHHFIPS